MGKKKVLSERELKRMVYPSENDILSIDRSIEIFWRYTHNQVEQLRNESVLKIE